MPIKNLVLSTCFLIACVPISHAADHPCAVGSVYSGTVDSGAQAEKFQLEGQTPKFGLAGVYVPDSFTPSGNLALRAAKSEPDRYGRLLVQAFRGDEWVQGELLNKGKVVVYGLGQPGPCISAMRREERIARSQHLGVWARGELFLKSAQLDELAQKTGQFLVVSGRVLSVGDRKRRVYLNFGQNWSQDFTVSVVKKGKGAFKGKINDLTGLENRIVEVRGIVEQQGGPFMRVFDGAQLEIID